MRYWLIFLIFSCLRTSGQTNFPPIGEWREHLPYQGTIDVTASDNKVYAATPYSLFSIELSTKEINRISKVAGLSETGISAIKFDPVSKKLFIAYTNSNIDVLDEKGIHNIPELERENISGDKNIYHIYTDNQLCYLSTGLGVIVLDSKKWEIRDSWFIGQNGSYVKTNGFAKSNDFFYAATDEGLKKIAVSNNNPADFNNWQTISGTSGLPAGPARSVVHFNGKTLMLHAETVYEESGNGWNVFFNNGWPVVSINVSENKLLICQRQPSGQSQVIVIHTNGSVQNIQQPEVISFPMKAISVNNEIWVADQFGGLSHWQNNNYEVYKLNSPFDISTGGISIFNNTVYATAGSVNEAWNYQYNRSGIFKLSNGTWTNYNQYNYPVLDTLMDFLTVAVDPRDESLWAGSFGGGLLHLTKDGSIEIYKQNSPIGATIGDPSSYRVSGLAFDRDNNLWISNFGSARPLHVLKNDGSWMSFTIPFTLNINATAQILIDDANQKWIVSPLGNGLIVFDHNQTIDDPNDDKWRMYRQGAGAGNLPSNEVHSIATDKSGFIWIGTGDGIAVVQCPQDAFISGCEAVWPVIKEGAFANYLFKGQEVRSIAVDGADRKWVATSSGAWLIAPDGDKVLAHFTENNSPLLSNDVKSIAINGSSGEVFFVTAKGIVSFRGSATESSVTKNNVLVFPNPVPPDYAGTIGIKGLPENSTVKITETNGRLVYQTRSLGGQAIWNGRTYNGSKPSTGVYLVIAVDDSKTEKVVAKIVFVSR